MSLSADRVAARFLTAGGVPPDTTLIGYTTSRDMRSFAQRDWFAEAQAELLRWVHSLRFPTTVYRGLVVEKGSQIQPGKGPHWSDSLDSVLDFMERWDPSDDEEIVIMQGEARPQDVDWKETVETFIENYGSNERELHIPKGVQAQAVVRVPVRNNQIDRQHVRRSLWASVLADAEFDRMADDAYAELERDWK